MLEYSQELRRKGGESDDVETYLYLKLSSILVQVVHQSSARRASNQRILRVLAITLHNNPSRKGSYFSDGSEFFGRRIFLF